MPKKERDPSVQALLEGMELVGQLGLVAFLSFSITFGAGWALDNWLGTGFFIWIGIAVGIAALYWNSAKLLKKFTKSPEPQDEQDEDE